MYVSVCHKSAIGQILSQSAQWPRKSLNLTEWPPRQYVVEHSIAVHTAIYSHLLHARRQWSLLW